MKKGRITDYDKLMVIAQTYSYIHGAFTLKQLFNFIQKNNFKFHSEYTYKRMSSIIQRSSRFTKLGENEEERKFEAI